jgi:hypothetical protein
MLLDKHGLGHRAEYVTLFGIILRRAGYSSFAEPNPAKALLHPGPVIVTVIEDYRWSTYLIGLIRTLTFRRSVALFFVIRETLLGTKFRYAVKRTLLRAMRFQSLMSIFTILPHGVLRRAVPEAKVDVARLSHGWIDDPQLWDLEFLPPRAVSTSLSERAVKAAGKRRILMVSGGLDRRKGLEMISTLAGDQQFAGKILIVIAGKVAESDSDLAAILAKSDCIFEDRFISNEEMNSLYAVSDLVWCTYSPSYDQSSGIFGRAVQRGVTPIVRKGSIVEVYAKTMNVPVLSIDWEDPEIGRTIVGELAGRLGASTAMRCTRHRAERNIDNLIRALFGEQPGGAASARESRSEMARR